MEQAQSLEPGRTWKELSLVLTDDEGITPVNRAAFGRDRPTDVISFRYEPLPGEGEGSSGDVLVNVERARQEGSRPDGWARELALYIAHGCHHLAGATDDAPAPRARMRRRENAWLKKAKELGYLDGILEKRERNTT